MSSCELSSRDDIVARGLRCGTGQLNDHRRLPIQTALSPTIDDDRANRQSHATLLALQTGRNVVVIR